MAFTKGKSGNSATVFVSGKSGNPKGRPKGSINLSTHIKNILNDPNFETKLSDGSVIVTTPIEAIVKAMCMKAISGDCKAAEWLAKYGYANDDKSSEKPINVALVKFI